MTAEIAVYNRTAIALAADSAAYIAGSQTNKVFNNAEKLFALTKYHPVGLMIYGSSEINDIPWELIIKQYRKFLGENHFDTVEDYAKSFLDFTERFYKNLPLEFKENANFNFTFNLCEKVFNRIYEIVGDIELEDDNYFIVLQEATQNLIDIFDDIEYFNELSESSLPQAIFFFEIATTKFLQDFFEDKFNSEDQSFIEFLPLFNKLCALVALKPDPFDLDLTGLVFAGYGNNEFFSTIHVYDIYGIYDDKLRYIVNDEKSGIANGSTGLTAFAQESEVDTFMQGISESTNEVYNNYFTGLGKFYSEKFSELLLRIEDEDERNKIQDELLKDQEEHIIHLQKELDNSIRKSSVDKVLAMVKHLPKNELAYMAESLVNLTAFKRKVSNELDSVGGPIDVAVISKGDGFVWVKRKHYFPIELNKNYPPKVD